MGSLGDSVGASGSAGLTEMRTAPLWGMRLADPKHQLLHDGRATSLADAVLRHDGQALAARNLVGIPQDAVDVGLTRGARQRNSRAERGRPPSTMIPAT
jgi:CxxC motif-containing protein (DUF1111 family)